MTDVEGMLDVASRYFAQLFTASNDFDNSIILDLVRSKITADMNAALLASFGEDEIIVVVSSMVALRAPRIDGFHCLFYKKYWSIIGSDVTTFCLSVLNGEIEVADINKTHIVLITKIKRPKDMTHFRPISLYNVLYKIISKVIVNCMSSLLDVCIDEVQGAFVRGRLISDNTLIAYEVLHSLKMRKWGKVGNFALKLDMSKAYDRVE